MENKVDIVLLSPLPPPVGGIGTWTLRYVDYLNSKKITTCVVDESVIGKREVFGEKSKRNVFFELKRCINIWNKLKQVLRNKEPKIVHCNIPGTPLAILREIVSAKICRKFKKPFVLHFHSTISVSLNSKIGKFFIRKIEKYCNAIILLNQQSQNFLKDIGCKCDSFVVPNFVNNNEILFRDEINDSIKTILYVGGVVEEKGLKTVVDTAKLLPHIKFRLAGLPSDDIKQYIKESECKNIELLGVLNKKEVEQEYINADVFLFLTKFKSEGFSIALTEAMAHGLPCIATDWAANKEMLGAYANDTIVEIDNSQQSYEKILNLKSKEKRLEISIYNSNRVKELYSIDSVVERILSIYRMENKL